MSHERAGGEPHSWKDRPFGDLRTQGEFLGGYALKRAFEVFNAAMYARRAQGNHTFIFPETTAQRFGREMHDMVLKLEANFIVPRNTTIYLLDMSNQPLEEEERSGIIIDRTPHAMFMGELAVEQNVPEASMHILAAQFAEDIYTSWSALGTTLKSYGNAPENRQAVGLIHGVAEMRLGNQLLGRVRQVALADGNRRRRR